LSLPEPQEELTPLSSTIRAVEERYTEMTLLGAVSLKQVFQCRDNYTQRNIAYAVLLPGKQRPRFQELFMHEAWITSFLNPQHH